MKRRSEPTRSAFLATTLALSLVTAACSGGSGTSDTAGEPGRPARTITVSAAASLTDVFNELADDFTSQNPSVSVALNFASSGQLASQIREGAPADVAAFADAGTMESLRSDSLVDVPQVFATNRLAIVVPPGNPNGITSVGDLARLASANGIIALCSPDAPCGEYADVVLARVGVVIDVGRVTRAADARATLTAVSEGDADAAIVYETDAASAGESVEAIDIPEAQNVIARYPIATLESSEAVGAAGAFVELILSGTGREVLARAGFGPP